MAVSFQNNWKNILTALKSKIRAEIKCPVYSNWNNEVKANQFIADEKIDDTSFLKEKIEENRKVSLGMRSEIREYCRDNFDWSSILKKYKQIIESI